MPELNVQSANLIFWQYTDLDGGHIHGHYQCTQCSKCRETTLDPFYFFDMQILQGQGLAGERLIIQWTTFKPFSPFNWFWEWNIWLPLHCTCPIIFVLSVLMFVCFWWIINRAWDVRVFVCFCLPTPTGSRPWQRMWISLLVCPCFCLSDLVFACLPFS